MMDTKSEMGFPIPVNTTGASPNQDSPPQIQQGLVPTPGQLCFIYILVLVLEQDESKRRTRRVLVLEKHPL
jgi:hypothetical protein